MSLLEHTKLASLSKHTAFYFPPQGSYTIGILSIPQSLNNPPPPPPREHPAHPRSWNESFFYTHRFFWCLGHLTKLTGLLVFNTVHFCSQKCCCSLFIFFNELPDPILDTFIHESSWGWQKRLCTALDLGFHNYKLRLSFMKLFCSYCRALRVNAACLGCSLLFITTKANIYHPCDSMERTHLHPIVVTRATAQTTQPLTKAVVNTLPCMYAVVQGRTSLYLNS